MKKKRKGLFLAVLLSISTLLGGCAHSTVATVVNPVSNDISLNQVGYVPDAPKIAYTTERASSFSLIDTNTDKPVFTALISKSINDRDTDQRVYQLDFSTFREPGKYIIKLANGMNSAPFQIAPNIYASIFVTTMRSYELQRCGVVIDDDETQVQHDACHVELATLRSDTTKTLDVSGGWHDAGDFGKYMPTAAVTVGQLMLLQDLAPQTVKSMNLRLAEQKKGIPDTWVEVRVELDWMLKMQRADGGVYHRVTTSKSPGLILPEQDTDTQYVYDVTTPDTAMFAAAMARAARTYRVYDQDFSARALQAAIKAWNFLERTPPILNAPKERENVYKATSDNEKRLWAAVELYLTTGNNVYRQYVDTHYRDVIDMDEPLATISWYNTTTSAVVSLALAPNTDWELQYMFRNSLVKNADVLVKRIESSAYGTFLLANDYDWGSNSKALGHALNLAAANRIKPNPRYVQAIQKQFDWVLGTNPLSHSFVTGMGMFSTIHPHNSYVVASDVLIPGLLVGGPNARAEDGIAPSNKGPLSYIDDFNSYRTNENAINYNAPLVVLAGYLNETALRNNNAASFISKLFAM